MENPQDLNSHLANEQTFLAWIRTGIGIMAFGFVSVKFSLAMKQVPTPPQNGLEGIGDQCSVAIGIGLVAAGAITTLLSYLRYRQTSKLLRKGEYQYSTFLVTLLAAVIFVLSILLIGYMAGTAFQRTTVSPNDQVTAAKAAIDL